MYKIKFYSELFGESFATKDEDGSYSHAVCIFPQIGVQSETVKAGTLMKNKDLNKIAFFKTAKEAKAVAKEIIKFENKKAKMNTVHHFEVVKCEKSN